MTSTVSGAPGLVSNGRLWVHRHHGWYVIGYRGWVDACQSALLSGWSNRTSAQDPPGGTKKMRDGADSTAELSVTGVVPGGRIIGVVTDLWL